MNVPREALNAADGTLLAFLEPWLKAEYAGTSLRSQIRTAAALALRDAAPFMRTEPSLADWERELLEEKARAQFLADHQHVLINALELAANHAGHPNSGLREHYARLASELKELPCAECPS